MDRICVLCVQAVLEAVRKVADAHGVSVDAAYAVGLTVPQLRERLQDAIRAAF